MTWDEAEELWMANQCGMLRDEDRSRLAEATLILSNEKNRPITIDDLGPEDLRYDISSNPNNNG